MTGAADAAAPVARRTINLSAASSTKWTAASAKSRLRNNFRY